MSEVTPETEAKSDKTRNELRLTVVDAAVAAMVSMLERMSPAHGPTVQLAGPFYATLIKDALRDRQWSGLIDGVIDAGKLAQRIADMQASAQTEKEQQIVTRAAEVLRKNTFAQLCRCTQGFEPATSDDEKGTTAAVEALNEAIKTYKIEVDAPHMAGGPIYPSEISPISMTEAIFALRLANQWIERAIARGEDESSIAFPTGIIIERNKGTTLCILRKADAAYVAVMPTEGNNQTSETPVFAIEHVGQKPSDDIIASRAWGLLAEVLEAAKPSNVVLIDGTCINRTAPLVFQLDGPNVPDAIVSMPNGEALRILSGAASMCSYMAENPKDPGDVGSPIGNYASSPAVSEFHPE